MAEVTPDPLDLLPVWTIRPNWKGGVLERLEWLTDILTSETNYEQRRSLRLTPRRSFEATYNPTGAQRTYLDLILHRLGGVEWLFPIWHDQAKLGEDVAQEGKALVFDNRFREHVTGGRALVYKSYREWEVVAVGVQTDQGFAVDRGMNREWPAGTRVYPLRRCLVRGNTSLKALTGSVGESTLLFQVNEENPFSDDAFESKVIDGESAILNKPNRIREIATDQVRILDSADGETGLIYQVDLSGRSYSIQAHDWQLQGREAQYRFRSWLYFMRGRQGVAWTPTFNDDITLAAAAVKGTKVLNVDDTGYRYVAEGSAKAVDGRDRLWTGREAVYINSADAVPGDATRERLNVEALEYAYPAGSSFSFLSLCRLNQDSIELLHHTDSDGVMECSTSVSQVQSGRGLVRRPPPPPPPPPEARKMTVIMTAVETCNLDPNWVVFHVERFRPAFQPNGVGGVFVDDYQYFGKQDRRVEQTENTIAGSTVLRGQPISYATKTGNMDWTLEHLFVPPPGTLYHLEWQPAAFFCGSVGKNGGRGNFKVYVDDELVYDKTMDVSGNGINVVEIQF